MTGDQRSAGRTRPTPSSSGPGTATRAPTGPSTPSTSTAPSPPTTSGCSPPRRSPDSDRVLDIGCGTGQTTRDAARAAAGGSALGVDLSSRMLDYARRRAAEEGVTNASLRAGRRPDPPVPARKLRRRHQPNRRHVLR